MFPNQVARQHEALVRQVPLMLDPSPTLHKRHHNYQTLFIQYTFISPFEMPLLNLIGRQITLGKKYLCSLVSLKEILS